MKIIKWILNNSLFLLTVFLIVFIPLYPKLPLLGVSHTWVYVRLEDIFVALSLIVWFIFLLRKKVSLRTPLTIPIIIFWLVGALATFNGIIFIFPHIANVFPNVAILNLLRRVEYLSVFFVAFFSIKDKKKISIVVGLLALTMIAIFLYGLGERYLGFPAFLTMNEEFAKGIPLRLSPLARIPSTFAGHYDLAAYLVLMIPVMASMIFAFKKWYIKILLLLISLSGLILLLMTASRVSFVVYLLAISFLLVIQKKKVWIIPVIIASILIMNSFNGISQRFAGTISQVDLVVDARTGKPVGIAKTGGSQKTVTIEEKQSTGESLPQGTGFINLPSGTSEKTTTKVVYMRTKLRAGKEMSEITTIEGDFIIKKALAYDVSFTTRFQGEWPRALQAFGRNIFLGSGYSSINLATDNDYLRMLGETGIIGTFAFLLIFIIIGIYIKNVFGEVDSPVVKSFVLGVSAGLVGLGMNATLIDVFEASKVAFSFWLILGVSLGGLSLYQKKKINYLSEIKNLAVSGPAFAIYVFAIIIAVYIRTINNFFVGDDFVWLKWAANCNKVFVPGGIMRCESSRTTLVNYFLNSAGFFYRPGAKSYFYIMYGLFWLNQLAYHATSILIHSINAILVFILSLRVLKSKYFAAIAALFFAVLSVQSETVFWISSTGNLICSMFILLGLVLSGLGRGSRYRIIYILLVFACGIFSTFFYEQGIVAPFIFIVYSLFNEEKSKIKNILRWEYLLYLLTIPAYLGARYFSNSLWPNGDYNYNLQKLPFNFFGNIFGYLGITFFGTSWIPFYSNLRIFGRENPLLIVAFIIAICIILFVLVDIVRKKASLSDRKGILFSVLFFLIAMLPFLGLGNISLRYDYLGSFGLILLFVILLKALFNYLKHLSKPISFSIITIIVVIFSVFNVSELIRINKDWAEAGQISNRLLVGFNETFAKTKAATYNPVFYFVNTPIKEGNAWLFPVGLPDALWFTFQNEYLTVKTVPNLNLAFSYAESSSSARVFEFDKQGNVSEVFQTKEIITK